jgi:hypothetical protein
VENVGLISIPRISLIQSHVTSPISTLIGDILTRSVVSGPLLPCLQEAHELRFVVPDLRINGSDLLKARSLMKPHCLVPSLPPPSPTSTPSHEGHGVILIVAQEGRSEI